MKNEFVEDLNFDMMLNLNGGNIAGPMGPLASQVPNAQDGADFFWGILKRFFLV